MSTYAIAGPYIPPLERVAVAPAKVYRLCCPHCGGPVTDHGYCARTVKALQRAGSAPRLGAHPHPGAGMEETTHGQPGTEKAAAAGGTTTATKVDGTAAYFVKELYAAKGTRDIDHVLNEAAEFSQRPWYGHIIFLAAVCKWNLEGGGTTRPGT